MSWFTLLWKNLLRKKLRLGLTVFSVMIAFLLYGTLAAFEGTLSASIDLAGATRLLTANKLSLLEPMPIAHYNRIASVDGIKDVSYANFLIGYFQEPSKPIGAMGTDSEAFFRIYPEFMITEETRLSWARNRQGAIIGEGVAERFGWKVGDRVPITATNLQRNDGSQTWDFTIDGIYLGRDEQTDVGNIVVHYEYLNESRLNNKDTISFVMLTTVDPARNQEVASAVDEMFANSFSETRTQAEKEFIKGFLAQFGNINFILTSVISAAFFTILLITGNTMMIAIRERTGEIAVLRTLGFGSIAIAILVFLESLAITVAGGVPGIGIAWILINLANTMMRGLFPTLFIGPEMLLQAAAIMIAIGLIVSLAPMISILRIDVVRALGKR